MKPLTRCRWCSLDHVGDSWLHCQRALFPCPHPPFGIIGNCSPTIALRALSTVLCLGIQIHPLTHWVKEVLTKHHIARTFDNLPGSSWKHIRKDIFDLRTSFENLSVGIFFPRNGYCAIFSGFYEFYKYAISACIASVPLAEWRVLPRCPMVSTIHVGLCLERCPWLQAWQRHVIKFRYPLAIKHDKWTSIFIYMIPLVKF
jgi:hypothetical protein